MDQREYERRQENAERRRDFRRQRDRDLEAMSMEALSKSELAIEAIGKHEKECGERWLKLYKVGLAVLATVSGTLVLVLINILLERPAA